MAKNFIGAVLGMNIEGWSKGCNNAAKDVQNLDKKSTSIFKSLSADLGKKSTLGQSLKLLAGGGAIAALTMLGDRITAVSNKIGEMRQKFQDGEVSGVEMFQAIAREIPLFGSFFKAGEALKEAFSSTARETARLEAETKSRVEEGNKAWEARKKIMEEGRKEAQQWNDLLRDLANRLELAGKTGFKKEQIEIRQNLEKQLQTNVRETTDSDASRKRDEQIKSLTKQRDEIQALVTHNTQAGADDAKARQAAIDDAKKRWFDAGGGSLDSYYGRDYMAKVMKQIDDPAARQARMEANNKAVLKRITGVDNLTDPAEQLKNINEQLKPLEAQQGKARLALVKANSLARQASSKELGAAAAEDAKKQWAPTLDSLKKIGDGYKKLWSDVRKGWNDSIADSVKKNQEAADKIKEQIKTPAQKYLDEIKKIQDLKNRGLLNVDEARAAIIQAQDNLKAATPRLELQTAETTERIGNFQMLSNPKVSSPFKNLEQIQRDHAEATRQNTKAIEEANRIARETTHEISYVNF